MTTATLTTLVLTGFATGLLAQFLTVYYRLEQALQRGKPEQPRSVPLAYIGTGVIGAAGALSSIPLMMLIDYGRGGSGSQILPTLTVGNSVVGGPLAAASILLMAKFLELGDRRMRFFMLVGASALWVLVALGVLLSRPA